MRIHLTHTIAAIGIAASMVGGVAEASSASAHSASTKPTLARACLGSHRTLVLAGPRGCAKGLTTVSLDLGSLAGPEGPQGPQGEQGPQGPRGATGGTGATGPSQVLAQQSADNALPFATPVTIATLPLVANTDYAIFASGVVFTSASKNTEVDCTLETSGGAKPYGDTTPFVIDAPVTASDLAADATIQVGNMPTSLTLSCEDSTAGTSAQFSDGEFMVIATGSVSQF